MINYYIYFKHVIMSSDFKFYINYTLLIFLKTFENDCHYTRKLNFKALKTMLLGTENSILYLKKKKINSISIIN